ncbi:MAG TPA: NAD-binding protein [Acidimicrobiales bacterium]|nr:NAD-binding protein [Acidimicrobiales bacterium]
MKVLGVILNSLLQPLHQRNTRLVAKLSIGLVALIALYSVLFHVLMHQEGRSYSWLTAVYWTLTVMSTLGFGDITFASDAGRMFTLVVLVSGAIYILVLLPFVFIQFVFLPWMARRDADRLRRAVDGDLTDHVVMTELDDVTESLIRRLTAVETPYVLIVPDPAEASSLRDRGYDVMVGPLDDPATYRAARAEHAALVVTTRTDMTNTNVVFTVGELSPEIDTVATASSESAAEVLAYSGCDTVLRLGLMLGQSMFRRMLGNDGRAHVIGQFGDLLVAEAAATGREFAQRSIGQTRLRSRCRVTIAGVWRRGAYVIPRPDIVLEEADVMILVGSADQLALFDATFGTARPARDRVLVIGGGRVGRSAAYALGREGIDTRIIEKLPERVHDPDLYVHGDASDRDVLNAAGFADASSVLITTHDDDLNIYLTIYYRRLTPELQIIARANNERNVATLHRAGADSVLSYASEGATAILNALGANDNLVVAEGLEMFTTSVPAGIAGRDVIQAGVRQHTGCNIVGIRVGDETEVNPEPDTPIPAEATLIVIGDAVARAKWVERYPLDADARERSRHQSRARRAAVRRY